MTLVAVTAKSKNTPILTLALSVRIGASAGFDCSLCFFNKISALIDCLINPLQEQMEEWKKVANQLDKDHAKGSYRGRIL